MWVLQPVQLIKNRSEVSYARLISYPLSGTMDGAPGPQQLDTERMFRLVVGTIYFFSTRVCWPVVHMFVVVFHLSPCLHHVSGCCRGRGRGKQKDSALDQKPHEDADFYPSSDLSYFQKLMTMCPNLEHEPCISGRRIPLSSSSSLIETLHMIN